MNKAVWGHVCIGAAMVIILRMLNGLPNAFGLHSLSLLHAWWSYDIKCAPSLNL